jgi:hypothetical protein
MTVMTLPFGGGSQNRAVLRTAANREELTNDQDKLPGRLQGRYVSKTVMPARSTSSAGSAFAFR